jgi:hypothetical protein
MLYVNKSAKIPRWMMEYSRDESPRRWWDSLSAPYYHKDGTDAGSGTINANGLSYNRNQDSYIIEQCLRWWEYWTERPGSAVGTGARFNAGGVKIEFCDGTTFNRSDESFRRSGIVDGMRLPKDAYGAFRVMWNGWIEVDNKDVYIVGHWNYAAGVKKYEYVVSNCDKVELFVNNVSQGFGKQTSKFLFTFPNIAWAAGTVKAVGYTSAGVQKAVDQRVTAGAATQLKLTVHTSPVGLRATGADIALVDVEVLDANGVRCPTANNSVSFTLTGPATWRGGIAHGTNNFILATTLPVESGINRVAIRPTATAGTITLQATAAGLAPAQVTLTSTAVPVTDGLTTTMPDTGLPCRLDTLPSYDLLNPAPKSISVLSATVSGGTATSSYDDNESTNWSGSWIQYAIASQPVSMVKIKFNNFKATTYPLTISVGGTQVYSGTSYLSLGYWQTTFPPTTGNNVRIAGTTGNIGIIEAELYGPGTTPVVQAPAEQVKAGRATIQRLPGRVVVSLPGNDYGINVVDLFGRIVHVDQSVKTGAVSTISISTKKLAAGMYILDILKASQHVQKEKLFVR